MIEWDGKIYAECLKGEITDDAFYERILKGTNKTKEDVLSYEFGYKYEYRTITIILKC